MNAEDLLRRTYDAFNARDVDTVLTVMHPDVVWPNAMEGGCVLGHAGIGEYWTRQWSIVDPHVEPLRIATNRMDAWSLTSINGCATSPAMSSKTSPRRPNFCLD